MPAIAAWFALNIIIGNLNGWILRSGFAYPALLTYVHMVVCHVLAMVSLLTFMRPDDPRPITLIQLSKVRKLSVVFAASVAAGNLALQYIYVSFAQMVTAAGPLFTILLMYSMTGKRYSRAAYASMVRAQHRRHHRAPQALGRYRSNDATLFACVLHRCQCAAA